MAAGVGVRVGAIRARREGGLAEGAACAIDWHGSVWRRAWERCGWGGEDGGRREQGGGAGLALLNAWMTVTYCITLTLTCSRHSSFTSSLHSPQHTTLHPRPTPIVMRCTHYTPSSPLIHTHPPSTSTHANAAPVPPSHTSPWWQVGGLDVGSVGRMRTGTDASKTPKTPTANVPTNPPVQPTHQRTATSRQATHRAHPPSKATHPYPRLHLPPSPKSTHPPAAPNNHPRTPNTDTPNRCANFGANVARILRGFFWWLRGCFIAFFVGGKIRAPHCRFFRAVFRSENRFFAL